jgi:chlorite dismutase
MSLPVVKLNQGIHVMHLFYRLDRRAWGRTGSAVPNSGPERLAALCAANNQPCHPRLTCYAGVGGKADLAFLLQNATLDGLAAMHREVEACFPASALQPVYSYLSVTELTEYMPGVEDAKNRLIRQENLAPDSPEFEKRFAEEKKRVDDYMHYRLYPELPDWEAMCFYPMNKKRELADNWYMLEFERRRQLMGGHAKTGRKYAGRIVQMITGSTGLDDWEWGVTLVARQVDAIKEIVYEMRFDEVSARYGEFGQFYINLRLAPGALWEHLKLPAQ